MKGKFIVIEGLDGCGKTTQLQFLKDRLTAKGIKCELASNVSDSIFGKVIREANLNAKEYLFNCRQIAAMYITEHHYITRKIVEKLEQGITILCSRHYLSTLVYAGDDFSTSTGIRLLGHYEAMADVTYFINVSLDTIAERLEGRKSGDHWEIAERQQYFQEKYMSLIKREKDNGVDIVVIDGDRPIIAIVDDIELDLETKKLI